MPPARQRPNSTARLSLRPARAPRLLAALACVIALAGCAGSAVQPQSRPQRSDLVSILQDDGQLFASPLHLVHEAGALGVDVLRANVFWGRIAPDPLSPTPPAGFDGANPAAYPAGGWAIYDELVRDAAAEGIRVYFTLTGPPPLWAAGHGQPHTPNCPCSHWMPSASEFGAFVRAVGTRYDGSYTPSGAAAPLPRVSWWSIWNEPNYGPNLAPQAIHGSTLEVSPRLYRALLDAGWSALEQTGHRPSRDTILIGEIAPRGLSGPHLPGNFSGMVPLRFLRALYCVDGALKPLQGTAALQRGCPATSSGSAAFRDQNPGLFDATGLAIHPYPDSFAPDFVTPFDACCQPDYADFAVLGRLYRTLDGVFATYGSNVHMPLYSTEFGYKTDPPYAGGVPPALAAQYLNQAEYLSWLNPRLRSYDQYLLLDPVPSSGSQFDTGLRFADGQPKPYVYDAFRMPLYIPVSRTSASRTLEVWGCVRPAATARRTAGEGQRVEVQFAAASEPFRTLHRVPLNREGGCYFDVWIRFPRSGSVRLAWRSPSGWLYSRTQAISVP